MLCHVTVASLVARNLDEAHMWAYYVWVTAGSEILLSVWDFTWLWGRHYVCVWWGGGCLEVFEVVNMGQAVKHSF